MSGSNISENFKTAYFSIPMHFPYGLNNRTFKHIEMCQDPKSLNI
jgi:hypothetical protein